MKTKSEMLEMQKKVLEYLIQESEGKVASLKNRVSAKEAQSTALEGALNKSKEIAKEIEEKAIQQSKTILDEAKKSILVKITLKQEMETEIKGLQEELALYDQMVANVRTIGNRDESNDPNKEGKSTIVSNQEIKPLVEGAVYAIKLVSFLNARHYVTFNGIAGPVHAHSWQIIINAQVNVDNQELIGFSDVNTAVKTVIEAFENKVLNEVYPFNVIQPTTENISFYFYNQIQDVLAVQGMHLDNLAMWETPTKGVEVTGRYQEFDQILNAHKNIVLSNQEVATSSEPKIGVVDKQQAESEIIVAQRSVAPPSIFGLSKWIFACTLLVLVVVGFRYSNIFLKHEIYTTPPSLGAGHKLLVIGKYGRMVKEMFLEVEQGESNYLDDYSLNYLKNYRSLLLVGAEWRTKSRAEKLVKDYAASGGQVFIEFSGMKENVLSRTPQFLGVDSEMVSMEGALKIFGWGKNLTVPLWSESINLPDSEVTEKAMAYVPMGLDQVELEFFYYGNQAPIFGHELVEGNRISFLGGNLIYHAFLTRDEVSISLISEILGLIPQDNNHSTPADV